MQVGGGTASEPLIVTFNSKGNDVTADHTYEEVEQAFLDGRVVIGAYAYGDDIPLERFALNAVQNGYAMFSSVHFISDSSNQIEVEAYWLLNDDTVEFKSVLKQ